VTDLPDAIYVGHGCDFGLEDPGPMPPEPVDLAGIRVPRALVLRALSVRIDAHALELLAGTGISVVLLGFSPSPEVSNLIKTTAIFISWPLARRSIRRLPPSLRRRHHPSYDEPFTWSMEPHKLYNYGAAALRSVLLNCGCPPAFAPDVT